MSDNTGFFRNLAGLANDYVDTKRRRLKGTPKTRAESGGSKDSLSWDGQEASRDDLRRIKKIRESGGVVARMIRAKALLSFGTGVEFHVEDNEKTATTTEDGDEITLEEWLEDEFDDVEEIVLDIGEDAIWYPYGAAELVETKTDGFSHVEPVEPWTLQPTTDERGNIVQWDQEIRTGGKRITEPFEPEEIKHFVINKSSARDKTGISEVLRSEEEIESYKKNQKAMRNAIEMHGYPEWHVQAGVSGSTPVNDQDLRRVINMVERSNGSGDTVTATGPDVEFNRLDPGDIMLEEITSNDLQKLALALGLPIEAVDFGSEGLGSGEQSKVRRAIMELDIIATQRAYMSQWVDKIIRPVVKDYSPFDSTRNLEMRLEDPLTSNEDMASLINDVGEYMTSNEARAKLGLPEKDGLDDEYGAPGEGGEEGGDTGFFSDGRALAVPDNAVSIDNPSEAPDGAQIVEGDRGGLYYVPSGGGGGGGGNDEVSIDPTTEEKQAMIASTPDELPTEMNPNNAEGVEDFESGRMGQDQDMQIARMSDSPDLMVKPDPLDGETDATAAIALNELSESAPDTAYVESEDILIQTLEGEGSAEEVPANQDSYVETFASTVAIGEADPNAGNFIVDDSGDVTNVDTEAIEDVSESWVQDTMKMEIENQHQDMGFSDPRDAVEAVNGEMERIANDIDIDALEESMPDTDTSNTIVENLRHIQETGKFLGDASNTGLEERDSRCLAELSDDELANAPEWDKPLLEMHQQVWVDSGTRILNFSDSATPEFVKERIRESIMGGAVFSDFEGVPSSELMQIREYMTETLAESDGWTVDGLADQLEQIDGIDSSNARTIARTESASVLNSAREEGYKDKGQADDTFYWSGNKDNRVTSACAWLIDQTNPYEGGDPVPLDELKDLIDEAPKHDPDMADDIARPDDFVCHPNERKTWIRAP